MQIFREIFIYDNYLHLRNHCITISLPFQQHGNAFNHYIHLHTFFQKEMHPKPVALGEKKWYTKVSDNSAQGEYRYGRYENHAEAHDVRQRVAFGFCCPRPGIFQAI